MQNYMYGMRYGNYSWWNPNTYALLRQKSSSAKLINTGGEYVGWYFYQVIHTVHCSAIDAILLLCV
jgi:hypothetical protein